MVNISLKDKKIFKNHMAFSCSNFDSSAIIEKWLSSYQKNPKPLPVNFRKLVPSLNSSDRATHLIHPYPAKLLMHIPFFFLNCRILSKPKDVILDPFSGSGTVLLEAILAERYGLGAEVNPLARLITKVKTNHIDQDVLKRGINNLFIRMNKGEASPKPDVVNLDYWFYPEITYQLCKILRAIDKTRNQELKDYFKVCFSICAKKVSLADPNLSVPVRLKPEKYAKNTARRKKMETWLKNLKNINVAKVFETILLNNLKRFQSLSSISPNLLTAEVISSDARSLSYDFSNNGNKGKKLPDNSVNMIITSPPYPGAQKYIRSSCFGLGWLDICRSEDLIDLKYATIGREEQLYEIYKEPITTNFESVDKKLLQIWKKNKKRAAIAGTYLNEMKDALNESFRVLKKEGYFVLVAANNFICGQEFKTIEYLKSIALDVGFSLRSILIDDIRSYGLMTKRNHTASIITQEWVLILQK